MHLIRLDKPEMNYPIGLNLCHNLDTVHKMADIIGKTYSDEERSIILWCRGSSGAIMAAIIASRLFNRTVIINHVKKPGEEAHSECWYTKNDAAINIIIDDFVRSGRTIKAIIHEVERFHIKLDCLCVSGLVREKYTDSNDDILFEPFEIFDTIIASQL